LVATVLVGSAALVAGCSTKAQQSDELMVTDNPVAATAAVSPPVVTAPAGTVVPQRSRVTSMVVDQQTRLLAVGVDASPAVLLYSLDDLGGGPRTITLDGAPSSLSLARAGGPVVAAGTGRLIQIALPSGAVSSVTVGGDAASTAPFGDSTLVAARDRAQVLVMDRGSESKVIQGNLFSADQVLSTSDRAVVLDRLRNGLFELDVPAGEVKQGLRAGEGATNAVTDRFGRVLVADTRGGALLAFSLDPLLMRQRYPVGGAPYGIAYDPARDLVWVTLTATNEVVGYHIAGEEPRERYRFPTVAQPNTVTVDPATGRVFVASANGEGIQVISL
jgi:DNA-binding beta-propeller fold protein YncE